MGSAIRDPKRLFWFGKPLIPDKESQHRLEKRYPSECLSQNLRR